MKSAAAFVIGFVIGGWLGALAVLWDDTGPVFAVSPPEGDDGIDPLDPRVRALWGEQSIEGRA